MPYATDYVMQSVALRYEALSSCSLAALAHVTPCTGTRLGDRSFNATDPQIWSKLPASMSLTTLDTLSNCWVGIYSIEALAL